MLDKNKVRLGIAPIAWTNDDMPDLGKENTFEQCVSEMALAGFTGSEVGGKYPTDTAVLKKALDLRNISICNQWFSSFLISKPYEETEKEFIKATDFLKEMGAKVIGVSEQSYSIQGEMEQPVWEGKYIMNEEEWRRNLRTDTGYSYDLAKRMEQYRTNPVLGYRTAGSRAEFETGEMLVREMESLGLSDVHKDRICVDSWEFEKQSWFLQTAGAGSTGFNWGLPD